MLNIKIFSIVLFLWFLFEIKLIITYPLQEGDMYSQEIFIVNKSTSSYAPSDLQGL